VTKWKDDGHATSATTWQFSSANMGTARDDKLAIDGPAFNSGSDV
jgi:hypothetical protein